MNTDVFVPHIARIDAVRDETPDTKTFTLRFREPEDAEDFRFLPGQFVELSVFGYGEAPFCIASSPTRPEAFETTIRRTGTLTDALHQLGARRGDGDTRPVRQRLRRGRRARKEICCLWRAASGCLRFAA